MNQYPYYCTARSTTFQRQEKVIWREIRCELPPEPRLAFICYEPMSLSNQLELRTNLENFSNTRPFCALDLHFQKCKSAAANRSRSPRLPSHLAALFSVSMYPSSTFEISETIPLSMSREQGEHL